MCLPPLPSWFSLIIIFYGLPRTATNQQETSGIYGFNMRILVGYTHSVHVVEYSITYTTGFNLQSLFLCNSEYLNIRESCLFCHIWLLYIIVVYETFTSDIYLLEIILKTGF